MIFPQSPKVVFLTNCAFPLNIDPFMKKFQFINFNITMVLSGAILTARP